MPIAKSGYIPYEIQTKFKKQKEKTMPAVPPPQARATTSGATFLESEQPWVPRPAWTWESGRTCEPWTPRWAQSLVPCGTDPNLRMQAGPPGAEPSPVPPRNRAPWELARVSEVGWSLPVDFSPAASRFPPLLSYQSTFSLSLEQFGICQGKERWGARWLAVRRWSLRG